MGKRKIRQQNTLVEFLQALITCRVLIQLRNDTEIIGTVEEVDGDMNVYLCEVTVKRPNFFPKKPSHVDKYSQLFVIGRNIRYVELPDVDVEKTLKAHERYIQEARSRYSRDARAASYDRKIEMNKR